ncbi:uncharacterized protein LOC114260793 [Camellia sinensis]|uniref:uncharacterized protein LOC114260793 n=1 Tax=Camellia sinensis TaxID=4442 RepID=UPI0010365E9A|nr:uncharacterized protein LOC114260793 [Camellia sinensis]
MKGISSKPKVDHADVFPEITLRSLDLSDTDDFMIHFKEQAINFIQNIAIPHQSTSNMPKNRVIGSVSVNLSSGIGKSRAELSYAMGSEYWGRGIITMAVKMVVSIVFGGWPELERIEAIVVAENLGS